MSYYLENAISDTDPRPKFLLKWVKDERKRGGTITACDMKGNRVVLTDRQFSDTGNHRLPLRMGVRGLEDPECALYVTNGKFLNLYDPVISNLPCLPKGTPPGIVFSMEEVETYGDLLPTITRVTGGG